MDNAFPRLEYNWNHDVQGFVYELAGGLTKREAFAMAALQGISANPNFFGPLFQQNPRAAADYAVDAADALIAALAKNDNFTNETR